MKRVLFSGLVALAFSSGCSAKLDLEVLAPAQVSVPGHIQTIAFVDRSRSKNVGQGLLGALEGALSGEAIGADSEGREAAAPVLRGARSDAGSHAGLLRGHLEEQRQKALQDPLTGLPNRAAWNERLDLEFARWQRYGGDLLLAVLDVDHFKRVNDGYGPLAGDRVLKIIGTELQKRLRKTDFIARFGGEEFVVLLPNTPYEAGRQLMETLRESIGSCPFHFKGGQAGFLGPCRT